MTIIKDDAAMQSYYGMDKVQFDEKKFDFRMDLLIEEFHELMNAKADRDPEEIVDALVDIIVIAVGTLSLSKVDVQKAWSEVYRANMSKKVGVKPGREQSDGFDLMKPDGWKGPDHSGNHGILDEIFTSTS